MALPEHVKAEVIQLWKEGRTGGEIAGRMQMTRNSVIGIIHRAGLSGARTVSRMKPRKRETAVPELAVKRSYDGQGTHFGKWKPSPERRRNGIAQGAVDAVSALKRGECRYPIGDPRDIDFHFCGKPSIEGRPYCSMHCRAAYSHMPIPRPYTPRDSMRAPPPNDDPVELDF